MDVEQAQEVIENICPCRDPFCPDSAPGPQSLLDAANATMRDEDYWDSQIAAAIDRREEQIIMKERDEDA